MMPTFERRVAGVETYPWIGAVGGSQRAAQIYHPLSM